MDQYFNFDDQEENCLFQSNFSDPSCNLLQNPPKFNTFSLEDQFWSIGETNYLISEENITSDGGSTSIDQKYLIPTKQQLPSAKQLLIEMTSDEKQLIQKWIKHLTPLENKYNIKLLNLEMFDEKEIESIKGSSELFPYPRQQRKINFCVNKKSIRKISEQNSARKLGRKAKKTQLRESEKLKNNRKFFLQKVLRCMTSIPQFQKLIEQFCKEEEFSEKELFNYFSDAKIKEIGSLQSIQSLWDNSTPAKKIFVKFCKYLKANKLDLRIVLHSKATNKHSYLQSVQKLFACISKPWLLQPQK